MPRTADRTLFIRAVSARRSRVDVTPAIGRRGRPLRAAPSQPKHSAGSHVGAHHLRSENPIPAFDADEMPEPARQNTHHAELDVVRRLAQLALARPTPGQRGQIIGRVPLGILAPPREQRSWFPRHTSREYPSGKAGRVKRRAGATRGRRAALAPSARACPPQAERLRAA